VRDVPPEALERLGRLEVGMDGARPTEVRRGHDRPVRRPRVGDRERLFQRRKLVAAGPPRIDVVEQPWRGASGERDPAPPELAQSNLAFAEPRRDVVEVLVADVPEARPLHVRVVVVDVDELGAGGVRLLRNGACDLFVADLRSNRHDLAGLHVRAEADGELRETLDPFFHGRRS
jgi:hypothetical protein